MDDVTADPNVTRVAGVDSVAVEVPVAPVAVPVTVYVLKVPDLNPSTLKSLRVHVEFVATLKPIVVVLLIVVPEVKT